VKIIATTKLQNFSLIGITGVSNGCYLEKFFFYIAVSLPILPVTQVVVSQSISEEFNDQVLGVAFDLADVGHDLNKSK